MLRENETCITLTDGELIEILREHYQDELSHHPDTTNCSIHYDVANDLYKFRITSEVGSIPKEQKGENTFRKQLTDQFGWSML